MKWLNDYRMRLIFVGFMAAMVFGGGSAKADFTFGKSTHMGAPINSSYNDYDASISTDGLTLFFGSRRPGGSGDADIWVATRPTQNDPWDTPVNLGPTVNSPHHDTDPSLSTDGLSLFFRSNRVGSLGGDDIWLTTRATIDDEWGEPVNLGPPVNSSYNEADPSISSDGLSLYFSDYGRARPGGYGGDDLWGTTRATTSDPWGEPVNLGPLVNTAYHDCAPCLSPDGLMLLFDSERPGGYGDADLWFSTRKTIDDNWGTPVNLGPNVNSTYLDRDPSISSDGFSLYFGSLRPGGFATWQLWQAPIFPIVDFNSDGIVDTDDMCIMVDYWGTDEPSCDIGPMLWGDGIVDIQDLILLAEHLFTYPGAVAYWKLDETEGNIAHDSICGNDGTVNGEPAWQPEGGIVDGVLQFDGIDDCVSTEFVLNPSDGEFSIFVWVKGGAPGQVVISQIDSTNLLLTDPSEGNLMTELKSPGRSGRPMLSQTNITDGNWYRIGLVWDGSNRTLYVDDIVVAEDTQGNLESSDNSLYIGTGKAMEAGSFWFGLIDDVRIYNRAVRP